MTDRRIKRENVRFIPYLNNATFKFALSLSSPILLNDHYFIFRSSAHSRKYVLASQMRVINKSQSRYRTHTKSDKPLHFEISKSCGFQCATENQVPANLAIFSNLVLVPAKYWPDLAGFYLFFITLVFTST